MGDMLWFISHGSRVVLSLPSHTLSLPNGYHPRGWWDQNPKLRVGGGGGGLEAKQKILTFLIRKKFAYDIHLGLFK
jgi:hypothetical protein